MAERKLHLAIIPDGNRRWAKKHLLKPWQGHEQAMENARALVEWCRNDPRIAVLTLWGFSTENWNRSPEEVQKLMEIYEEYLKNERTNFVNNKTRLLHSGRTDRIPASLAKLIVEVATETADNYEFTMNFAVDYGGKDELLRAIKKLDDTKNVTEESLRTKFDQPGLSDIDLVIRTSGEQRTSGFAIWEAAYAEWIFEPKLFPDLVPDDLERALNYYEARQRRFGA
jgi:undecaprenyl diphosphate synthase